VLRTLDALRKRRDGGHDLSACRAWGEFIPGSMLEEHVRRRADNARAADEIMALRYAQEIIFCSSYFIGRVRASPYQPREER